MWTAFEKLSDETILKLMSLTADACVFVEGMTNEQKNASRGKDKVSAQEAGTLSAMFATAFSTEVERRGI